MYTKFMVSVLALSCIAILLCAVPASAQDLNGPPDRPDVFRNPQELRDYLKQLNEYFAIVGRPRFGRTLAKRSQMRRNTASAFQAMDLNGDGAVSFEEFSTFVNGASGWNNYSFNI